jgi:hypothetical protein
MRVDVVVSDALQSSIAISMYGTNTAFQDWAVNGLDGPVSSARKGNFGIFPIPTFVLLQDQESSGLGDRNILFRFLGPPFTLREGMSGSGNANANAMGFLATGPITWVITAIG